MKRLAVALAWSMLLIALLSAPCAAKPVDPAAVDALLARVGYGGIGERESQAAQAALVAMGPDAVPILMPKLSSPDARIRRCVAEILLDIQPVAEPTLLAVAALAGDKADGVSRVVCDKLASLGGRAAAAAPILERASDRDSIATVQRLYALARITGKSDVYVPRIAAYLERSQFDLQTCAATRLGRLGPAARGEWPRLLKVLKDPNNPARGAVTPALGEIGADEEPVIDALIDALKNDPEIQFRRSAAVSLGQFGAKSRRAVPALEAAMTGDAAKSHGWWVAARAVGQIGGPEAVRALVKALDVDDRDLRTEAVRQLAALAPTQPEARAALEQARKHPVEEVRNLASSLLAQLARRAHVFVSGRVQGVGFRAFTAEHAEKRGLTGWVKNLNDGRVEAVVEGPTAKVAELLELLKRGPAAAQVDKVEVTDEKPTGEFKDFKVRYE